MIYDFHVDIDTNFIEQPKQKTVYSTPLDLTCSFMSVLSFIGETLSYSMPMSENRTVRTVPNKYSMVRWGWTFMTSQ